MTTGPAPPAAAIDYQPVLDEIERLLRPTLGEGSVASYIPELAKVPATRFGMALTTPAGDLFEVGDARERFSVQSISKVFSLTLAMQLEGEGLWKRTGREPSGNPFNSLVQLERENGIPRNPFINAGALVSTDIVVSHLGDARQSLRACVRGLCGAEDVDFDLAVAASERATGHRNTALAYFIASFGNLENDPQTVLDAYFHHCALSMSCVELSRACLYLANEGRLPSTGEAVTTPSQTKYINALMLTCGTYDAVGDFAYRVGLPAKSGVGGGIVAAMPRQFSVCVWSPPLDEHGNSLTGLRALELLTSLTGVSIF